MRSRCKHDLCDDDSMCRRCRMFGYGREPDLPERLSVLAEIVGRQGGMAKSVLDSIALLESASAMREAAAEITRRREREEREARS